MSKFVLLDDGVKAGYTYFSFIELSHVQRAVDRRTKQGERTLKDNLVVEMDRRMGGRLKQPYTKSRVALAIRATDEVPDIPTVGWARTEMSYRSEATHPHIGLTLRKDMVPRIKGQISRVADTDKLVARHPECHNEANSLLMNLKGQILELEAEKEELEAENEHMLETIQGFLLRGKRRVLTR